MDMEGQREELDLKNHQESFNSFNPLSKNIRLLEHDLMSIVGRLESYTPMSPAEASAFQAATGDEAIDDKNSIINDAYKWTQRFVSLTSQIRHFDNKYLSQFATDIIGFRNDEGWTSKCLQILSLCSQRLVQFKKTANDYFHEESIKNSLDFPHPNDPKNMTFKDGCREVIYNNKSYKFSDAEAKAFSVIRDAHRSGAKKKLREIADTAFGANSYRSMSEIFQTNSDSYKALVRRTKDGYYFLVTSD